MYLTNAWLDTELVNIVNNSTIGCVITTYEKFYMMVYDYNLNLIKDFKHTNCDNEKSIKQSVLHEYLFESSVYIKHNDTIKTTYLYRIPRTLKVAYTETHLFNNIKIGMTYVYNILECKDVFSIIANQLFELVRRDLSLYICANKID